MSTLLESDSSLYERVRFADQYLGHLLSGLPDDFVLAKYLDGLPPFTVADTRSDNPDQILRKLSFVNDMMKISFDMLRRQSVNTK